MSIKNEILKNVNEELTTDPSSYKEEKADLPNQRLFVFKTDGIEYGVAFSKAPIKNGTAYEVIFGDIDEETGAINISPTGKGNAPKVFSTVNKIIEDFIVKEKPEVIDFIAEGVSNSRLSIYKRFARRISNNFPEYKARAVYNIYTKEKNIRKIAIVKENWLNKNPDKKVNERIKLKKLLNDLLLEAVDLSDGSKVIRALERGQVPGVKKKVFLKTSFSRDQIEETLNNVIGIVSNKVGENDKNKYLFLIFKRAGNVEWLDQFRDEELNEIVDSMMAYFGNKNKKEAKENEEVKKKFEEYENSKLNFEDDKKFEQWVNEKFAHKAKAKDDDIDVVYDDGEWNVSIPKTFAAAKKLACMADRKARWCTAAQKRMFSSYSSEDNPLFIIRNEKKDLMYQMDWGRGRNPNFMDEKDKPAKIIEVLGVGIPEDLWKSIKNKDGESVYDKLKPALKKDETVPLDDTDKTPEEELDGWRETVFITVDDFMNDVSGKKVPDIFVGGKESMRDILSGDYEKNKSGGAKRIAKYEKEDEVYYHIVPYEGMRLNVNTGDKAKIVLKDNNNSLKYIKTDELLKSDLPKFFTDTERLSNTEKTEGDMNGWNEYIYSSTAEFLREIMNYEMPKMIGNAQVMTRILKSSNISQIGKVSKGKKVYYYLIPKPGDTIMLGVRDIRSGSRSKEVERIAFQLNGNKLTIKTAKTIGQSDLPDALKQKLFTQYKYPIYGGLRDTREEPKKNSLSPDQLKKLSKSEMPVVAYDNHFNTVYTNVNTFSKIMNIPNLGENATEKIKEKVMSGDFKPANVLAVSSIKIRNKKYIFFILNSGGTYLAGERGFLPTSYFHKVGKFSTDFKEWLWDNFFRNSNVFSKEEKEAYDNILKDKPIHKFKDGTELRYEYRRPFLLKNGKEYYKYSKYGGKDQKRNYTYITSRRDETLSDEEIDELEKQGLEKYYKIAEKMAPS